MPARLAANEHGAVCLRDILDSFNAPIKEEHAWALCYQCAKCFSEALAYNRDKCYNVTDVKHVWVHGNGTVHSTTIFKGGGSDDSSRRPLASEHELIVGLGVVIFNALDAGYDYGEERQISRDLEELIDLMTSEDDESSADIEPHQETDDEGIERDSGDADEFLPGPSHGSPHHHHPHNHQHHQPFTLHTVLQICGRHVDLTRWEEADSHYRAVCRALVAEALELATFLERVSSGTRDLRLSADADTCRDLDQLNFQDWARFWVQVIGELRMGVKLKKVDYSRTPIEYELTPYEILMDDIRSRRYKLKKIMVDGDIPQRVKKDAHALILEFIRSRPPLRKVSDRKLAPLKRAPTPREQLLDSIKRGQTLRPICRLKTRHSAECDVRQDVVHSTMLLGEPRVTRVTTGLVPEREREPSEDDACEDIAQDSSYWDSPSKATVTVLTPVQNETPKQRKEESEEKEPTTRRLIKVDFSVLQGNDDDDDEEDEDVRFSSGKSDVNGGGQHARHSGGKGPPSPNPWRRTGSRTTRITHDEYHHFCDTALESYDLATQCPTRRASMRRHTLSTCGAEHLLGPPGTQSVPQSRPASRQSRDSSETDSQLGAILPEMSWSRSSLQDELIQSRQWQEAMSLDDRLSLTLEEIVHIRSVLTKAELEALPVEGHVKEDVEKRKVCFLCLKTRFGIFGPWGQRCKLCKRTVCAKCYTKMRIPTEHFSNVPVVLLSPSLMSSPEDESKDSFPRSLVSRLMVPESSSNSARNSVGSAPSSPNLQRGMTVCGSSSSAPGSRVESSLGNVDGPQSLQPISPASTISERRSRMSRAKTLSRPGEARPSDRLKGMQMIVCHDCKIMVIQIIKSSRTSRSAIRNNAIRNLTLNLSPVY